MCNSTDFFLSDPSKIKGGIAVTDMIKILFYKRFRERGIKTLAISNYSYKMTLKQIISDNKDNE